MINRNVNSEMTIEDAAIFAAMPPLAHAWYLIQDKVDAAAILEQINADEFERKQYINAMAYAAANHYSPEY